MVSFIDANGVAYGVVPICRQLSNRLVAVLTSVGPEGLSKTRALRDRSTGSTSNSRRAVQLWVADFIYIAIWAGFVYVAFVIDVFARRIIGWRVARAV